MKSFYLCFISLLLFGCKTTHMNTYISQITEKQIFKSNDCIENAVCTLEIIPNSNLLIKNDEFKNTYIELEKGENVVIKYQLKKNPIANTADSNYSEILYIETDSTNKELHLKDINLQEVKMIFARLCFCKGSSGYFKVKNGQLDLSIKKNELTLHADFSVENIPQITTKVNEKIILR